MYLNNFYTETNLHTYAYICIFISLIARQSDRKRESEKEQSPSTGTLPKYLQNLRLDQVGIRSQGLHSTVLCGWKGHKCLSCGLLVGAGTGTPGGSRVGSTHTWMMIKDAFVPSGFLICLTQCLFKYLLISFLCTDFLKRCHMSLGMNISLSIAYSQSSQVYISCSAGHPYLCWFENINSLYLIFLTLLFIKMSVLVISYVYYLNILSFYESVKQSLHICTYIQ